MYQTAPSSKRIEKVREACETIENHIHDLAEQMLAGKSDQLLRYPEFTARLHRYSFRNILLALSQRENITQLAGIRQWNQSGRRVRRGEKDIVILAPMTARVKPSNDSDENPEENEKAREP